MNVKWIIPVLLTLLVGYELKRNGVFAEATEWAPEVVLLNDSNFKDTVRQHPWSLVVVSATWCGPCKRMKPEVNALAAEISSSKPVFAVDYDQSPGVVDFYGLQGVPVVLIMLNGKEVQRQYGIQSRDQLKQWLDEVMQDTVSPKA